ncbi:hypothetical protein NL676_004044 [Syzygium grande]|nr:hypothetical protein NL676_004044 [Syzygium grande]
MTLNAKLDWTSWERPKTVKLCGAIGLNCSGKEAGVAPSLPREAAAFVIEACWSQQEHSEKLVIRGLECWLLVAPGLDEVEVKGQTCWKFVWALRPELLDSWGITAEGFCCATQLDVARSSEKGHCEIPGFLLRYSDEIPGFLLRHPVEKYGEISKFLLGYSDEIPKFLLKHSDEIYGETSRFLLEYSDEIPRFLLKHSGKKYDEKSKFLLGYLDEIPRYLLRHSIEKYGKISGFLLEYSDDIPRFLLRHSNEIFGKARSIGAWTLSKTSSDCNTTDNISDS